MSASPAGQNKWRVDDGKDVVFVWLSRDGVHVQRFTDGVKRHKVETLSYDKIIPAAEGQMLLWQS